MTDEQLEPPWYAANQEWKERVEQAKAAGAEVFQKNGLPIACIRHDGALLEHEHADHPDYKFPVEVEYHADKPDTFHDRCVCEDKKPEHYRGECKIEWDHDKATAFCATCGVWLTQAEQVHILAYSMAEFDASTYEPHTEALIYRDDSIAITLYECCYTMWHRKGGGFLHGPDWSKKWRLTEKAREKIWGKDEVEERKGEA
jgi:uncharacterized DUF497 family protein